MTPRTPVRTCVGCRGEGSKYRLRRLVRGPDGVVRADPSGRAPGRGAYLHLDPACLERARRRRALERALRGQMTEEVWTQLRQDADLAAPRPTPE